MPSPPDRSNWLKGPKAPCDPVDPPPRRYNLVLLGAPGVGKGTQAALLSSRLGACHLSTGDLFRAARTLAPCDRTPALTAAVEAMQRGELVSDDTVLELVRERVDCLRCNGGFLLDGFPRTLRQARALDRLLEDIGVALDAVLMYELPVEEVVARIGGRRVCPACKAVYHVTGHPPRVEGICDACGTLLIQRDDDRPEAVRVRMETYLRATLPLVEHYRALGLLMSLPADGEPEEIYGRTMSALEQAGMGLPPPSTGAGDTP